MTQTTPVKSPAPHYLMLLLVLTTQLEVIGQYLEKDFRLYTVKNGLSDNQVTCLQQDEMGYMWIGTKGGLNRFDGTAFRKFNQGTAPLNLPSDLITRLKNFGRNTLGIFSRGGFQVLNTKSYRISNYIIPDSTAFTTPLNAAWDAVQLRNGSYAMTTAAGFYVLNEKGLEYRHDAFSVKDIGRKQILYGREIFHAGNNNYVVYTNEDGQALYNSQERTLRPIDKADYRWNSFIHPQNFPGDRWVVKRQLNEEESVFIPVKTDSIIFYNSATKKRTASALPAFLAGQLNWESQIEKLGDSLLVLHSGYTGFYRLRLNRETGKIIVEEKKYLSNYHILCMFSDKEGRLWVGTTQGLLKQDLVPHPITSFEYNSTLPSIANDDFTAVYRYKDFLYAGQYSRHHGLSIIDPATMKRVKEIQFYGNDLPWNEILSIQMYHPDTLWLGTWAGPLWYDTKTGDYGKVLDEQKYPWAAGFPTMLAAPGNDGYAWFCALLGGRLVRYHIATRSFSVFSPHTNPALPFEKVKGIVYDSYGDVWISGHALNRWSTRKHCFDTLLNVYAGANKFNDDIVVLTADDKGSLWLHNADNGVLEYKIREKRFVPYTMQDGLPSAVFGSMSKVINHKLWIATSHQLCEMDTRSKEVIVYDHNDGFPGRIPTSRKIYFDPIDSLMYLCAENTLVRFPLEPEKIHNNSGELLMEELTVNNHSTDFSPLDNIELGHTDNNLGFRFTVVDFENNNYQFAYRLDHSSAWHSIGSQRSIAFNNLSPGEYTIELSAIGKPGIRKSKSILVVIHPPLWKRSWFIALSVSLLIVVIYWLFRQRLKSVKQKAAIDRQLSQTQMKALQSQMNPHFIFNSLNSIRAMILSDANKEASHYLGRFAQLIRITLEQSTEELVLLRTTIDYLQRYIEMETIRNEFITYEMNVGEGIDQNETLVSPMIIQPFVENAIWHGVSATCKHIRVKIDFQKSGNLLVCTVEDNGIGISHAKSLKQRDGVYRRSHGIRNVQDRIRLLSEKYSLPCSITIVDKKDGPMEGETGTLVTILLPYQTLD